MADKTQACFGSVNTPAHVPNPADQGRQVRHVMEPKPVTVTPDTPMHEARAQMQRHDVTHLPVLAKGRLVGLLSERDIQTVLPSPATSLSKWELHYLVDKLTVRQAMTADIMTVTPTTSLSEAVRLMLMHRIGALPVVENHRMVGLLTRDDILRIFLVDQAQSSFAA